MPTPLPSLGQGATAKLPPGLSPERFARWFSKDGDAYRPVKEIRDLCVFSEHSLIKDPPFSKLDLISCRNVLIYFNSELQHRVMRTFHYALRPGGYPVSRALGERHARSQAVYRRRQEAPHPAAARRGPRPCPTSLSSDVSAPRSGRTLCSPAMAENAVDARARRALEPFSPAYFVIDARNEIIRFSGAETGHYLQPSSGPPSLNLFAILRKDLRQTVRTALQQARASNRALCANI